MTLVETKPRSPSLPRHLRPRRERVFGDGRPRPLDRNAKARVMVFARALKHRTTAGKHYGALTAKFLDVLAGLLWGFHNAHTGKCFPSYDTIAERVGCARSTVYEAIRALEAAGVLTWVNRLVRIREPARDLFGNMGSRWRVIRTSNAYAFIDPNPGRISSSISSEFDFQTGTKNQELNLSKETPLKMLQDPNRPLEVALKRLAQRVGAFSKEQPKK